MFITRVNELNDELTYSDRLIVRMIFENYSNFDIMTSQQIAKSVGVAQATVIRFSKKLGFPSFKSMMMDIKEESFFYASNEVQADEGILDTVEKLKNSYEVAINDVLKNNPIKNIEKAIEMIEQAERILCFGVRISSSIVGIMYYRLLETGFNVVMANNLLEGASFAKHLTPKDVLFIVSVSGESDEAVGITNVAVEQQAQIISITGLQDNATQRMSTVALRSSEFDMRSHRYNLVNRSSPLFLLDCIYMNLWKRNSELFTQRIEKLSAYAAGASPNLLRKDNTYRF